MNLVEQKETCGPAKPLTPAQRSRVKWWVAGWIGSSILFIVSVALAQGWFGLPAPKPGLSRHLMAILPTVSSLAVLGVVLVSPVKFEDEFMQMIAMRAKVMVLTVALAIIAAWSAYSKYAGVELPEMWPFSVLGFISWALVGGQFFILWKYR